MKLNRDSTITLLLDHEVIHWLRTNSKRLGVKASDLANFSINLLMQLGGDQMMSPIDRANLLLGGEQPSITPRLDRKQYAIWIVRGPVDGRLK